MAETTAPAAPQRDVELDADGMDRGVGFLGLLWASEGSIIGSGWLFGALTAASIAGPSAIIAWVLASLIIDRARARARRAGRAVSGLRRHEPLPALRVRELRRGDLRLVLLYPGGERGADRGPGRRPVRLDLQLGSQLVHEHRHAERRWASSSPSSSCSLFVIVNLIGIKWLARVNNALTSWKVFIPILTIIVLAAHQLPRLQLQPRRRLLRPRPGGQGHPDRDPRGRDRLLAAGFRAGRPARRRGKEPVPRPSARRHPLDPDRRRDLRARPDCLHRRARSRAASQSWDVDEHRHARPQRSSQGAQRGSVLHRGQDRRRGLAGRDPAPGRDRLARRHRPHLPHLGLADQLRPGPQRVHSRARSSATRSGPGCRCSA